MKLINLGQEQVFPVFNGFAPEQGPKALSVELDFSTETELNLDFTRAQQGNAISFIQSVYVDNTDNPNPVTFQFDQTRQRIVVPAYAQGEWPVIATDTAKCIVTTTATLVPLCRAIFKNVPMPLTQWGPISVNVAAVNATFAATVANFTNRSGNTTAGASAQIMAANPARKQMIVQNPANNAESLWINFGAAADAGTNSYEIPPGQKYESGNTVSGQAINIYSANVIPYMAKEA